MFGTQTFNFVFFAVLFACASTVFGETFRITGSFTETRSSLPNSKLEGTFYYLYSDTDNSKARLRFEYNLPDGTTVSNLYHYKNKALYSMCPGSCTAETIVAEPDRWWYNPSGWGSRDSVYTKGSAEGDYNWFTHKSSTSVTQVSRILMNSKKPKEGLQIKTIEFTDGRIVQVEGSISVNPSSVPEDSAKFSQSSSCPPPTCSMFADIVFVLDSSGSVSPDEWDETTDFVVGVMNSFTFGDDAAAAACVQFNAPDCGTRPKAVYPAGCPRDNWHVESDWDYEQQACLNVPAERKATVLAGEDVTVGYSTEKTVSINRDDLINIISQRRTPNGGTCQAFGLELAMKVFDRSPRMGEAYTVKPHRVVIAMTDGVDYCPNRTLTAANKLREEYGALFVSVAVGLDCAQDRDFIKSLASDMDDDKIYFEVNGYSQITTLIDKVFSPLCEQYHSECGPECHGFCGCGDCFCPKCIDDSDDVCEGYTCTARDGTSTGCSYGLRIPCGGDDLCTEYKCVEKNRKAVCEETPICQELDDLNPGTCREVSCMNGTCIVERNPTICNKFNNGCETWECANENETATDLETGCVLRFNQSAYCESQSPLSCLTYTCNPNDWTTCFVEDICAVNTTKCQTSVCTAGDGGRDYCAVTPKPSDKQENECDKYICDHEKGWILDVDRSENAETCRNKEPDTTCRDIKCNPAIGCEVILDEQCAGSHACAEIWSECETEALKHQEIHSCGTAKCQPTGETAVCANIYLDCSHSEAAEMALANNTADNYNQCLTIECDAGSCITVPVPRIEENTECIEYLCVGDKENGWHWEPFHTELYNNCVSDNCTERYCDDRRGCMKKDICESRSDQCTTYTCVVETDNSTSCEETDLRLNGTCMYEECIDGVKKQFDRTKSVNDSCTEVGNDNHCWYAVCNKKGECEYKKVTPPGNDPCTNYTCDNETGWSTVPKCDDGLSCTEDKCSVDGYCRHLTINCYLEVNMSEYPCFRAECKEGSTHSCVRKLKNGVFIDVCGNCISNGDMASSASENAFIECTDAPDQPLNKEGLAAASIALIVLGAVIIGAAVATSGVIGTKSLLDRARAARNQTAQNNPLFEGNETEMSNPTFAGEQ